MSVFLPFVAGALVGCALGAASDGWLTHRAYRYSDERDLRLRSTRWVIPATAFGVGLIGAGYGASDTAFAIVAAAYAAVLTLLAAIDLDVRRLPDAWTIPTAAVALCGLGLVAALEGSPGALLRAVLASAALAGFYLLQVLIARGRGMGLGDVKLALSLGAVLGYLSWSHVFVATLVAYVAAALIGVFLILFRGGGRRTEIAFGPSMALGCVAVLGAPGVAALLGGSAL